jgi:hypothetical protein
MRVTFYLLAMVSNVCRHPKDKAIGRGTSAGLSLAEARPARAGPHRAV